MQGGVIMSMCIGVCNMFGYSMKQQQMKRGGVEPGLVGVLLLPLTKEQSGAHRKSKGTAWKACGCGWMVFPTFTL